MLLAFLPLVALAAPPCDNAPLYQACDISFDGPANSPVFVEFRAPDYKTYRLPAFALNGKLHARIAPTQAGNWTYRVTGGATGQFSAAATTPFAHIKRSNVHHWEFTEALKPHFYAGAWFTKTDDLKPWSDLGVTHLTYQLPLTADPAQLERAAADIAAINSNQIIADLLLAPTPADLEKAFPTRSDREAYSRALLAHFASFNLTWHLVNHWESSANGRALLKEIGLALKQGDPYNHPRTARAQRASAPLGQDGWMDFTVDGPYDPALTAIEHQLNTVPQLALVDPNVAPDVFRRNLWNTSLSGAYIALSSPIPPDAPNAKTFGAWATFFQKRTRFWDIEPFFDLDGGRSLAIPGRKDEDGYNEFQSVEYIVFLEKGAVPEVRVQKHSYDVWWVNPTTGEATKEKKDWKGDIFTGRPPDQSNDWVLHLSRDGRKEGMLKSYKFESWPVPVQEPERDAAKAPFELLNPAITDTLTTGVPIDFTIRLKRQTGGTRRMQYLLTGEVVRDGQGTRILATGATGSFTIPADILTGSAGVLNVRLAALNAAGKIYVLDYIFQVRPRR